MLSHPLLSRIADQIAMLAPQACPNASRPGLLVALSGGPDSVALLLGARQWSAAAGCPVEAAHLNHALRMGPAEADQAFCRELCADLQVVLHEFREDPRPLARARGLGLEEAGRHLRRRLLGGLVARSDHLHCIATGHHLDDQSETVIMRLFRGTGPLGLRGIRPVHGNVIHPLLAFRRRQILACLQDCGQAWRLDASNEGRDNTRARVRHELLPLVRDIFGPGCETNPARLAALLELDQRLLEGLTARTLATVAVAGPSPALDVPALLDLDPALAGRVLRAWLLGRRKCPKKMPKKSAAEGTLGTRLAKIHADLVLRWLRSGQSGTGLDLPGGWRLERDFALVRLRRTGSPAVLLGHAAGDFRILVKEGPDSSALEAVGRDEGPGPVTGPHSWELTCPAAALQGNLRVRNLRPGDRLQPFGSPGTRKLSDLLREGGIPRSARAGVLVADDDAGILWVVGLARTERTRLLPTTGKTVTICICPRAENPKQGI